MYHHLVQPPERQMALLILGQFGFFWLDVSRAAAAGGSNRRVMPAGRGGRGAAASRGQGHAGRARGGSAVGPRGGGRAAGQRRYGGMCIGEKKEPRSGKEKAAARE